MSRHMPTARGRLISTHRFQLVVWGGFVAAYLKLGRQAVWVHEGGIRYRVGGTSESFLAWEALAGYRFTRVVASRNAALANAVFDPWHLRKGTRFSFGGGGDNFVAAVVAKDGRSVAVNSGFSNRRRFCETIVERVDGLLLPELLRRLRAGETVSFGDVSLDARELTLPDQQRLPLAGLVDLLVLDGQVWLDEGAKKHSLGSVLNAYALQAAFLSLRGAADLSAPSKRAGC